MSGRGYASLEATGGEPPAVVEAPEGLLDEEEDDWQPWHPVTAGARLGVRVMRLTLRRSARAVERH